MSFTPRIARPLVLVLVCAGPAWGEIRPEFAKDHDPEIRVPAAVLVFSERLKPLWLEALARPEADMQRMAADAIGRAHRAGCPGMEQTVADLVGVLTAPTTHPAARLAAARALVVLEAKETAPQMAASAGKHGAELRQIVEPALAEWNFEPYRAVWQARLTGAGVHHRDVLLAIRGLAAAGDRSAVTILLDLVHDRFQSDDVRLEAAHGAGRLQERGLEGDARRLISAAATPPLVNRLSAVRLIARHTGDEAQRLLAQFAVDAEPAVGVIALMRLNEIDPQLTLPLAEGAMLSADAKVRQCGAEAYIRVPGARRIAVLARLLDDPHPGVRGSVREAMFKLAQRPELAEPIRRAGSAMLAGDRWRGLEQAALLLAALDEKSAAPRLVELLEFSRPEVGIAAGWGLKTLALSETLPAMLDKASRNTEVRKSRPAPPGLDEQTAHLFEAFGRMEYRSAEPLLRRYVPKDYDMGAFSRSSAIWSLGLLHAGVPDEGLAAELAARASDMASVPPEMPPVQLMSIVGIGRMKAVSQVKVLRRLAGPTFSPTTLGMTLRWALMEVTGEQLPEPEPFRKGLVGMFLEPLED